MINAPMELTITTITRDNQIDYDSISRQTTSSMGLFGMLTMNIYIYIYIYIYPSNYDIYVQMIFLNMYCYTYEMVIRN